MTGGVARWSWRGVHDADCLHQTEGGSCTCGLDAQEGAARDDEIEARIERERDPQPEQPLP